MTEGHDKIGGTLKQPPQPNVKPDSLVGHIVQIALGESDIGGHLRLIPPLKVTDWAQEVYHYATEGEMAPEICFLGIPLKEFRNPVQTDARLLRATGIRFKSRMPLFQPHFLMDADFLEYFEQSEEDVVPVEVFATDSKERMDRAFLADEYNFVYIGEGVLQLFVPSKGFQKPWPKNFPWHRELKNVEEWLILTCSKGPENRR